MIVELTVNLFSYRLYLVTFQICGFTSLMITGIISFQSLSTIVLIMRRKLREVFHGNIPHGYRNGFASIDGKRFEISRPAGPNNQQYYAYNTYYAYHQLGYQSIVAPDGLIIHWTTFWLWE